MNFGIPILLNLLRRPARLGGHGLPKYRSVLSSDGDYESRPKLGRNPIHGKRPDWQIFVGDFIGFDRTEVITIKEYKIILRLGDITTSLNQLPMWQEVPGNRVEFGN